MELFRYMIEDSPALVLFVALLVFMVLRFVLIAGFFRQYLWRWGARRLAHLRIQSREPDASLLPRAFGLSVASFAVFSLQAFFIHFAVQNGWSKIYFDVSEHGWPWFWFSIAGLILVHDAHFYWTHRLFHRPALFRRAHVVHHRLTNPEPWGSFAFHPLEAFALFAIVPVLIVLVPLHVMALVVFVTNMTAFTVLGHIGYEIYPRGFTRHWLLGWLNTPTHHNMHHRYGRCNYGLYFNFWDHWMGTNHPRYHDTFEAVKRGQPMKSVEPDLTRRTQNGAPT